MGYFFAFLAGALAAHVYNLSTCRDAWVVELNGRLESVLNRLHEIQERLR